MEMDLELKALSWMETSPFNYFFLLSLMKSFSNNHVNPSTSYCEQTSCAIACYLDLFTDFISLSMSTFILIYVRRWECTIFQLPPDEVFVSGEMQCMANFTQHVIWSAAWSQSNYVTTAWRFANTDTIYKILAHNCELSVFTWNAVEMFCWCKVNWLTLSEAKMCFVIKFIGNLAFMGTAWWN